MSKPAVSMRGKKYEFLYAIERLGFDKYRNVEWLFRCDCGNAVALRGATVRIGRAKSCGCIFNPSATTEIACPDGEIYCIWHSMLRDAFKYGEARRGIAVCYAWRRYRGFEAWAKSHGFARGARLMRRDENDNYDEANCYFAAP